MNFKLIEVEINEKDFPDQKEFAIYITKNEMLKIKEKTKTNEYKLAIKLKKKIMNFKLIEVENNEKDFTDQKEFAIYITKNEMLKIKEKTKTNEYKLAIKLKKKYRVSDNAVYVL